MTAGSVDDGKSTLMGRLLYDSNNVPLDILASIERGSVGRTDGSLDLSLLTDGLRAEREQGITIDVAYKYFHTPTRKFIIADTPGHVQYTRNMVTGASNSEAVLLLVDARNGIMEQTRRHSLLCQLLGLRHFVLCVNKMDLVDYSASRYEAICADFRAMAARMGLADEQLYTLPAAARTGQNVVHPAQADMPWYTGPTLLGLLEALPVGQPRDLPMRFQVQGVIRPQSAELHDYRGYMGKVLSGSLRVGDTITALPSYMPATITHISLGDKQLERAIAPASVTLELDTQIDISRGDLLAASEALPEETSLLEANLCWMDPRPLKPGTALILQHNSQRLPCKLQQIVHKVDIETQTEVPDVPQLQLNDIARVRLALGGPVFADAYTTNPANGAFILIEPTRNDTVAGGMVLA